jgi:hypothetical protein
MDEFDIQLKEAIARRQAGREDSQNFQMPQGQMVGGRYIRPSFGQALVQGLRTYQGQKDYEQAGQQIKEIAANRKQALADALRQKNEAAAAEELRIKTALETMTPQQAIAAGVPVDRVRGHAEAPNFGRVKVSFKDVGGTLVPVDEYGVTPENVKPIKKKGNPFTDMLVEDDSGKIVPNVPLVGAKAAVARASSPQIRVDARNINTQESEQSKVYGKNLGEIRAAINQAGYDAPGKIARLDRMEELLSGIDGGAAAPAIAELASFANSLGIKLDPKLGNKQAAEALAREMAGSLRQPGTGPMTDKDFDNFLKQVPSLSKTAQGRTQIIRTMRAAIERDQRASKFARDYAKQNNGVIDDNFFDSLAGFYAKNPIVTPSMPKKNSRGELFNRADAIIGGGR